MNMDGETICGFYVSAEQKKINAVYLDLITEFGRLCQTAGITWWLAFGGLIGTVRHGGFIPWDDDVDLMLPRADFDRLRAMTNEEFGAEGPYFLQNPRTDPTCAQSLIRFRRSDTADIRDYDLFYMRSHPGRTPYNMGINLALFPLDAVPGGRLARKFQRAATYTIRGIWYRAFCPDGKIPLKHILCSAAARLVGWKNLMDLFHWLYRSPRRVREDLLQSFDGLYSSPTVWEKSDYAETITVPFEDLSLPAPAGYDRILTVTYRDYMQFPPEEKRRPPHGGHTDADVPYTQLLRELLASP